METVVSDATPSSHSVWNHEQATASIATTLKVAVTCLPPVNWLEDAPLVNWLVDAAMTYFKLGFLSSAHVFVLVAI